MFSSRNTKFAQEIMQATSGRGVNAIVNSLVGELLDASWRIVADGGTMVEIGKRDIIDRNTLAMEPFDRNCSFRAVDFSYTKDIVDSLIARFVIFVSTINYVALTSIPAFLTSSSSSSMAAISNPSTLSPPLDLAMSLLRSALSAVDNTLARSSYPTKTRRTYMYPSGQRFVALKCARTFPT